MAASGPTRVLRVFSRLNIGGPSHHVLLLSAGLVRYGYETRLIVGREDTSEGNLDAEAAARGVRFVRLRSLGRAVRPLSDSRALMALMSQIRTFRPQILHTHTAKAGVLGRFAGILMRVPIMVHTYHGHVLSGYFGRTQTGVYRTVEAALARRTSRLVAVSDAVRRDLLERGVGLREQVRVVPLGLDLMPFARPLPKGMLRAGVPPATDLVGIVGRLVPIKDVPVFLEAAARVQREQPNVHFAVVGDGAERSLLEDRTRAFGLGAVVCFHGWQTDMRGVYGDLDVVVNCSRNEGTPVALIEAMAAGVPVVATRVGGTPDLLENGAHGRLVAPGDPEALAAAILEALRTRIEEREANRVRGAQRHVLVRHSVERLLSDMDGLYSELLAPLPLDGQGRHGH